MTAPYTAAELAAISARAEASALIDLLQRSGKSCPIFLKMVNEGKGQFHIADLRARKDAIDYVIQADWIDDLLRWFFHAREDVPRLVAELTRAREALREINRIWGCKVSARVAADAMVGVARGALGEPADLSRRSSDLSRRSVAKTEGA